jgi:hypothetical protein
MFGDSTLLYSHRLFIKGSSFLGIKVIRYGWDWKSTLHQGDQVNTQVCHRCAGFAMTSCIAEHTMLLLAGIYGARPEIKTFWDSDLKRPYFR